MTSFSRRLETKVEEWATPLNSEDTGRDAPASNGAAEVA